MAPFSEDRLGADLHTTTGHWLTGRNNKRPFVRTPHDNPAPSMMYPYPSQCFAEGPYKQSGSGVSRLGSGVASLRV
jgi:hypothetical protein